jgi:hypothetical protein
MPCKGDRIIRKVQYEIGQVSQVITYGLASCSSVLCRQRTLRARRWCQLSSHIWCFEFMSCSAAVHHKSSRFLRSPDSPAQHGYRTASG